MKYSRGVKRRRGLSGNSRRGRTTGRKRGQKSFGILPLVIVAGLFWGGWQLANYVFSNTLAESGSAEIEILRGRAEFQLDGSTSWTRAYSEQKFISGDRIKTAGNSRVSLSFLGGNALFLGPNTEIQVNRLEERSSGAKKINIAVKEGQIWTQVPEEKLLQEGKSMFIVETNRQKINVFGSIFDLVSNTSEDVLRLIRGKVESNVFVNEAQKDNAKINIGVGQKLVLNSTNIERINTGQDVLEITDNEFLESDWHLDNLEQFAPEEAAQIRRKIEISQAPIIEEALPTENSFEAPKIITPTDGTRIAAAQESVKLEGSAPLEAFQVSVNGYTLTKFQPGDRKWTYFASKKFGTMVPGENKYSIVAINREGKKSPPAEVTLFYDGVAPAPEAVIAPAETTEADPVVSNFPPPIITNPALADPNQPYETSTEVVTLKGTVPIGTVRVTVNDFVLKKFQPGNTTFSYIANANYGNLKKGENVFVVNAYGREGAVSETTVTVFFKPINL